MKITKYICDLCKKEVEIATTVNYPVILLKDESETHTVGTKQVKLDLCQECLSRTLVLQANYNSKKGKYELPNGKAI